MNILVIDSSDQVLSVALSAKTGVWYAEIDAGTRHSELLMDCIDWLLKNAEIRPTDLDTVACMKGPGSFTGLRIAFSAAKGLAMALKIPLITVPTLDCLAYPLSIWPGIVIPVIDAKKGCFFSAIYRHGEKTGNDMDASPLTLITEISKARLFPDEPVILTGPGAELLFSALSPNNVPLLYVDPDFRKGGARELLKIIKSGKLVLTDDFNSGPVYLRKSDAELNEEAKTKYNENAE